MTHSARRRPRTRASRAAFAALAVVLLGGLAACDINNPNYPAGTGAARDAVTKFFAKLEAADAAGAKEFLATPDAFNPKAFDNDFYKATTARPRNLEITSADKVDGGVKVGVKYRMGSGSDEVSGSFEVKDELLGASKITSWTDQDIRFAVNPAKGQLNINSSLTIPAEKAANLALLPGVYQVVFKDPEGIGTTNSTGGAPEAFAVQFPSVKEDKTPSAASQVDVGSGFAVISLAPGNEAIDAVKSQLSDELKRCASEKLLGSDCPAELVTKVRAAAESLGNSEVDSGSVKWSLSTPTLPAGSTSWTLQVPVEVRFSWKGGGREVLITTVNRSVSRDSSGTITTAASDAR